MKLIDYKKEIIEIAKANGMAWDIGRDMFLANIRNAGIDGAPHYPGADEVDYKALQAETPELGTQEYADMCNEFVKDFEAET